MTHTSYPVALQLAGQHCLVVGGGALATEKVEGLLRVAAQVRVVDPAPHASLRELNDTGAIHLEQRPYDTSDVRGHALVYGASEDRALNARVAADARAAGVLVNAVDDIPNCDFFAMSLVHRGELQVAVSTNGRSPALARWMREYLDAWLPRELDGLLQVLGEIRDELRARGETVPYDRWQAAISDDVLLRLRHGDVGGARGAVRVALGAPQTPVDGLRWAPAS